MSQAATARSWPGEASVLSGQIPPPADGYVPRPESVPSLAAGLPPGETTVLVSAASPGGGTGKTQLAAAAARAQRHNQAVYLVVWITASGADAVLGSYAQALRDMRVPDAGQSPERAATQFLAWLARTGQPWLVILDDLSDAAALDGLWPCGRAGSVLVTTNRADAAYRAPNLRVVPVGPFSPREAIAYLSARLEGDHDQRIGALDLAADLGHLPLALALAAAVMTETGMDCRSYHACFADHRTRLAAPPADFDASIMAATWSLSAGVGDQLAPDGLAMRALALVSMLAPGGIPGAVLTSQAARGYLSGHLHRPPADEIGARAAVRALARAGLVTIDSGSAARTVLVHGTTQALARQRLSGSERDHVALAAADALLQAWPSRDVPPGIAQALRDCTARLHELSGTVLWTPGCHPALLRAGRSLDSGGLVGPAVGYWQAMLGISQRVLGAGHPDTAVLARDLHGAACEASGRVNEAITVYEHALANGEHSLGAGHPDTIAARASLARAYRAADRADDAIRLAERTLADCEHDLGARHPETLTASGNLARGYLAAGRVSEAVTAFTRLLAATEQALGRGHRDTMAASAGLAAAYIAAGRFNEAIVLCEHAITDAMRVLGPDHPDTIRARASLAAAYHSANKPKDALTLDQRILADSERVLGPDHPDTITSRASLAAAYRSANKPKDALTLDERILADSERLLGPDHPETIRASASLAFGYLCARLWPKAVAQYERVLADSKRVFGPDHPLTQRARQDVDEAGAVALSHLGIDLRSPSRRDNTQGALWRLIAA